MRCTSNFRVKINRSIFLNFFIVPPPPILGRDEPNNTSMALTFFYYSTIYSYCLYKLYASILSKLSKAQVSYTNAIRLHRVTSKTTYSRPSNDCI